MERFTVSASSKRTCVPYNSFALKPQLRDPTFPNYLQPQQQPKPIPQDPISFQIIDETEISIFDAQRYFNEDQDQKESKRRSPLITNLDEQSIPRLSSVSSVDGYGRGYRTGSFHATPTASSEASWNSQTGLLSNPPGSIAVSMRNLHLDGKKKKKGSSGKWLFRRKCPCSGKKSVQVEEKFSEPKAQFHSSCASANFKKQSPNTQSTKTGEVTDAETPTKGKANEIEESSERPKTKLVVDEDCIKEEKPVVDHLNQVQPENCFPTEIARRRIVPSASGGFSFPILNPPAVGKLVLDIGKPMTSSNLEDAPRESLEVFRPSGSSMERCLDSHNRRFVFPMSPKNGSAMTDEDVMSDASSDLFEIESLSTQSTLYPMYLRRDSLDEICNYDGRGNLNFRHSLDETTTTPSIAPTECYEPSEVSIDWSVTTAEGFDRASVTNFSISASDYDDVGLTHLQHKVAMSGTSSKRRGNGLLSCRCEKAVNVGPHPVKFVPERHRSGAPIPIESGRFQATSRLGDMSSVHMTKGSTNIQRPHPTRISQSLTTR